MPTSRLAFLLLALACASACSDKVEYGYIARLGSDTTSVEHITHDGDRIIGDVVEQSPRVIRKRWEATFSEDGTLQRWTMNRQILNPMPGEIAEQQYTAELGADSVLVTEVEGADTRRYVMKDILPVTVPWESYVYGTYDLLFAAAMKQPGDSVPVKQYMPGIGAGRGLVRKQTGDSVTFVTVGLAGTGVGHLDADGRMRAYSGKHTTFKHEVQRIDAAPDIDAIARRFAEREKAAPARSLSARDTTRARIGGAEITIDYSRPLRRGRNILGEVVPYGTVWRTGANAATQLTTSAPISIANIDLAAGTYTLWTLPTQDGVSLIINNQAGQWGTRYNQRMDRGRSRMQTQTTAAPVDTFTIRIDPASPSGNGTLLLEWDRFRWTAPIRAR